MPEFADVPLTLDDESLWIRLYNLLLPKAKGWVYNSGVRVWYGQEYDVAWDIVLTAIERTLAYIRNAQQHGIAVCLPEHLSMVIAKNYYRDRKRHEQRLQRFSYNETEPGEEPVLNNLPDLSEEASEKIYEEWLLIESARSIAAFSRKLREAILIDLANRMHFGAEPTVLQQAFLAVGIRIEDYRLPQPIDPIMRSRQAALRSLAYKRLALMAFDLNCSLNNKKRKQG